LDEDVAKTLLGSNAYFFVGLDNGVAEEITLKAYEITRKMALFYPDTHIVHGVAAAIEDNCAIIFEPTALKAYTSDFQKFSQTTGCSLVTVGAGTALPGIAVATNELFNNYCLLAAGWGVLRNIGNRLGLDIDHPEKVSKVGNPFIR
jgi:glucosamine--fructose-6-phosphate aminotransferase (isomerizing)